MLRAPIRIVYADGRMVPPTNAPPPRHIYLVVDPAEPHIRKMRHRPTLEHLRDAEWLNDWAVTGR